MLIIIFMILITVAFIVGALTSDTWIEWLIIDDENKDTKRKTKDS